MRLLKTIARAALGVVAASALFLAVGCAQIKNGEITNKWFVPAHDITLVRFNPVTEMAETYTERVPDRWFILIQKKDEDGTLRERTVSVHPTTYDAVQIGQWFNVE